jgi:hypothetical protein
MKALISVSPKKKKIGHYNDCKIDYPKNYNYIKHNPNNNKIPKFRKYVKISTQSIMKKSTESYLLVCDWPYSVFGQNHLFVKMFYQGDSAIQKYFKRFYIA